MWAVSGRMDFGTQVINGLWESILLKQSQYGLVKKNLGICSEVKNRPPIKHHVSRSNLREGASPSTGGPGHTS